LLVALAFPALAWAPPRFADLRAVLAASPLPVVGQIVLITASEHNRGPDSVLDGTLVTTIPDGLTLLAAKPTQGTCTGTATVSCAFGLLGRQNQAFDAVASVRLLVRIDRPGAFPVTAEASSGPSSTDVIPDNNAAGRVVFARQYTGSRPYGRVHLKLVSATPRKVVVRLTGLGPDDAQGVVVDRERVGRLSPAEERTLVFRYPRPKMRVTISERDAYSSGQSINIFFGAPKK
jgi:hypothetical protein